MSEPAQFYTGLVADLYDALVSEPARADDYVGFLEAAGTPALELACGSGMPLVDLVSRGYAVEGLDSSEDMLARCRERAAAAGVDVTLVRGEMQRFDLGRRFRAVFLAGGSFTLLTSDEDALSALRCIRAHLEPGGAVLIPLEVPDLEAERRYLGHFREADGPGGARLRVGVVSIETDGDGNTVRRLRYERELPGAEPEVLERDWVRRSWSQRRFRELMAEAGFEGTYFIVPGRGLAPPDAGFFVALSRAPAAAP